MKKMKITSGVTHEANLDESQIEYETQKKIAELLRIKEIEPHNSGAIAFCIKQVTELKDNLIKQL
jgi:hypothetical protein